MKIIDFLTPDEYARALDIVMLVERNYVFPKEKEVLRQKLNELMAVGRRRLVDALVAEMSSAPVMVKR